MTRKSDHIGRASVCVACIALVLTFLTHDPVADGPRRQFALALLQLVMGSCVLGFVVLRHLETSMKAALLAGSSLVLVGAGIHAARLAHPLTRGMADTNLAWRSTSTLPAEAEISIRAPGTINSEANVYVMALQNGGTAAIQLTPKEVPRAWPWWAPLGTDKLLRSHRLTIDAMTQRTAPYLVVMNSGKLRVQLTVAGIMVTAPDGRGDVSEKTMTTPVVTDGSSHQWELAAEPTFTSLKIDGAEIWSVPRSAEIGKAITIGDASGDREHGGTIKLTEFRYSRLPVRPPQS
ncbi:MAG: hypothetical protein WCJ42_12150 [Actinomycetes bacterium]